MQQSTVRSKLMLDWCHNQYSRTNSDTVHNKLWQRNIKKNYLAAKITFFIVLYITVLRQHFLCVIQINRMNVEESSTCIKWYCQGDGFKWKYCKVLLFTTITKFQLKTCIISLLYNNVLTQIKPIPYIFCK